MNMHEPVEIRRLSYPAPVRVWYRIGNGWASRAWTNEERAEYRAIGGWFKREAVEKKEGAES